MSVRLAGIAVLILGCSAPEKTVITRDASTDPWVIDAPDLDVLDAGRCVIEKVTTCPTLDGESSLFTAPASSRIVAIRPPLVLLDPLAVVAIGRGGSNDTFSAREPDDAALRAVALINARYPSNSVFVLGCAATACRVLELGTKEPTAGLVRVGPELPPTTRAIAELEGTLWAAGDGLRRLDGTNWSVERPDGRFRALATALTSDGATIVAVGEGGRVDVRAHDVWTTTSIGTDETLTHVDLRDYVIAVLGERGGLHLGTRSGFQACGGEVLGARTLSFVNGPWLRVLFGITSDERAFTLDAAGTACRSEPLPGTLGGAIFACGVSMNRWRFTGTEIVGTHSCAID